MQRVGTNGRKRITLNVIFIALAIVLLFLDQITKSHFSKSIPLGEKQPVIDGFFYFTYTINTGAAWSFLHDVSWAQTFFKILTIVALIVFIIFYVYAIKKDYKWLRVAIAFALSGTIGNFIDRLAIGGVIDFIGFTFGTYNFPVFNLADSFLVVGVIMLIIHFLFIDSGAIFKKRKKDADKDLSNN